MTDCHLHDSRTVIHWKLYGSVKVILTSYASHDDQAVHIEHIAFFKAPLEVIWECTIFPCLKLTCISLLGLLYTMNFSISRAVSRAISSATLVRYVGVIVSFFLVVHLHSLVGRRVALTYDHDIKNFCVGILSSVLES